MVMWNSTGNGQNLYKNPFKQQNTKKLQHKTKNQIRKQLLILLKLCIIARRSLDFSCFNQSATILICENMQIF